MPAAKPPISKRVCLQWIKDRTSGSDKAARALGYTSAQFYSSCKVHGIEVPNLSKPGPHWAPQVVSRTK